MKYSTVKIRPAYSIFDPVIDAENEDKIDDLDDAIHDADAALHEVLNYDIYPKLL